MKMICIDRIFSKSCVCSQYYWTRQSSHPLKELILKTWIWQRWCKKNSENVWLNKQHPGLSFYQGWSDPEKTRWNESCLLVLKQQISFLWLRFRWLIPKQVLKLNNLLSTCQERSWFWTCQKMLLVVQFSLCFWLLSTYLASLFVKTTSVKNDRWKGSSCGATWRADGLKPLRSFLTGDGFTCTSPRRVLRLRTSRQTLARGSTASLQVLSSRERSHIPPKGSQPDNHRLKGARRVVVMPQEGKLYWVHPHAPYGCFQEYGYPKMDGL